MQAVVVDTDATAEKCINHLKKFKIGRAIFLPLNKMLAAKPRGKAVFTAKESEGFAIDLVKFDEKYRNAFWYVFGDTVVMENITKAREQMGGVRMVTLEGELIEASGAMMGGLKERSMLKLGAKTKGNLDEVTKRLRKATDEADKISSQLGSLRLELIQLEKELKEKGTTGGSSIGLAEGLDVKKKELKASLKNIIKDIEKSIAEMKAAEKTGQDISKSLKSLSEKHQKLKEQKEAKEKEMMKLTPMALTNEMKEIQSKVTELSQAKAELSANKDSLKTQLSMFNERKKELDKSVKDMDKKSEQNTNNIKTKSKDLAKLDTDLKAMLKVEESMGKELFAVREKRDEAYRNKTKSEAEVEKMNHTIEAKGDFLRGLKIELLL